MKPRNIISNLVGTVFLGTALAFGFWPEPSPETGIEAAPAIITMEAIASEVVRRQPRILSGRQPRPMHNRPH